MIFHVNYVRLESFLLGEGGGDGQGIELFAYFVKNKREQTMVILLISSDSL